MMDIRKHSKSWLAEREKEAALDAGKTVLVCRVDSTTRQRRQKYLTLIENISMPRTQLTKGLELSSTEEKLSNSDKDIPL